MGKQIPPASLRSRVGMTSRHERGDDLNHEPREKLLTAEVAEIRKVREGGVAQGGVRDGKADSSCVSLRSRVGMTRDRGEETNLGEKNVFRQSIGKIQGAN